MSGDLIDAGLFSEWLDQIQAALREGADTVVPCGPCTACCTSAQFVHIAPDETDSLERVPVALRFPAPGLPEGHVVLGFDEQGRCPMLIDGACTIYEHRPRTCRTYDCRVFAATGVEPEGSQPAIRKQVRRWRFTVASPEARAQRRALERAAAELADRRPDLHATARAVAAIETL